jgi:hypothetical protein
VSLDELTLLAVNSLAAATLLVAAAAKFAVPRPLRRALHELSPRRAVPVAAVRAVAVAEFAVALALLLPWATVAAGAGLGALGTAFMAAGIAGHLRRSSVPCGCLGGGSHALGLRNVVAGAVFLGVAGLNVTAVASDHGPWTAAPLLAAAATILLCLYTHRVLMWRLLRARPISSV